MIDRVVGEYKILSEIGRGGMGIVYLAEHLHLRQTYALKILPEELGKDESFIQHFYTEARTMASLKHPGIVQVVYMGKEGNLYYLVMEYVVSDTGKPKNLQELVKEKGGRLSHSELKRYLGQVCAALDYAHGFRNQQIKEGVVHRDLKPSNILIGRGDRVKLSDFGLAKVLGDDFMRSRIEKSMRTVQDEKGARTDETITLSDLPPATTEAIMGTYEYMSPEQKAGGMIDHRSDIFSLGVIIYNLLTGRKPIGRFKNPSEFDPSIPRVWDRVVEKCLQESPDDRFQKVSEIAEAVKSERPEMKRPALTAAMALTVAAIVLAGLISYAWWSRAAKEAGKEQQPIPAVTVESAVREEPQPQEAVEAAVAPAVVEKAEEPAAKAGPSDEAADEKYDTWYDRGIEKMLSGDREQAVIAFERALEYKDTEQAREQISSIKHETYLDEARSLAGERKYAAAVERYRKALAEKRTPETEEELKKSLGELEKEKRKNEKEEMFAAYVAKAREQEAKSQLAQAISSYSAALKCKPDDEEIQGQIARLQRQSIPVSPAMVTIKAGNFRMGNDSPAAKVNEKPAHFVYLDEYYIDKHEVTNKEYERFRPTHRSVRVGGDDSPVTKVSWEDAMAYCEWRASEEGLPEGTYRLPTEAEWEKAASASRGRSPAPSLVKVGSGTPNSNGVYDMPGNAWEWCHDWYDEHYYSSTDAGVKNPPGPSWGSTRSVRDIAWGTAGGSDRLTSRMGLNPSAQDIKTLGFRCVRIR